jgi:hypothetical protein
MTAALLLHRADGAPPTTSFRQAAFGPADPFARYREIAWEGSGAMSAGRVGLVGEVDVARYPHTETIVVVEGTLRLIAAEAAPLVLRRGEGAVIARGTALRIQAATRSLFVFCAAAAELANQPGIALRADANFKPSTRCLPKLKPGLAVPQRQRLQGRVDGGQAGMGLDAVPPHRAPAPRQRVHGPAAGGVASPAPTAACCRHMPAKGETEARTDLRATLPSFRMSASPSLAATPAIEIPPCPSHCA